MLEQQSQQFRPVRQLPLFSHQDFEKLCERNEAVREKAYLYKVNGFEFFWNHSPIAVRKEIIILLIEKLDDAPTTEES